MYIGSNGQVLPGTLPTDNGPTYAGRDNSVLGKDAFLKLLVTQLGNQDPLNPKSNEEYVAQLAQFSSLEQMQNINTNLQASQQINQSVNNALTASLIGKEVQAVGNSATVGDTGSVTLPIGVGAASSGVITIKDADGKIVRKLTVDSLKAGPNDITWDGKDDQGNRVKPGDYTYAVEARDAGGTPVEAQGSFTGIVSGVKFINGTPVLIVGTHEVPIGSVLAVRQPASH